MRYFVYWQLGTYIYMEMEPIYNETYKMSAI